MTLRFRQLLLTATLAAPLVLTIATAPPFVADTRAQGPMRMLGPNFPILVDSSGDGLPGSGDEGVVPVRAGNTITIPSRWTCNSASPKNVLTLSNPDAGGRFQTVSRTNNTLVQSATVGALVNGSPTGVSYTQTDSRGLPTKSGSAALVDQNQNGIPDLVVIDGSVSAMVSLAYAGNSDYISVPWSQASVLGVDFTQTCGGSQPQIWIPLADTNGDGAGDTIVPDLDGNGQADPDLFTSPPLAPVPTTVSLDRTVLNFGATNSGGSFLEVTTSQTVRILQTGTGTVSWSATATQPWITVSPSSGTSLPATLAIGVVSNSALPISGISGGAVNLSFTGTTTTAGPISVNLTTMAIGASVAPAGVFETPSDNATGVTGSIAVTGWAIDDIDVQSVKVWRDPVAGEGSALIFIGDAVRVDGARPDIVTLFPTTPRHTLAGWGYLLLTNFLPNLGNGTFRLRVIVTDVEGKTTTLPPRTITCTNSTSVTPFGAIDTPGQGEVVSGTSYDNFGWVLVRGPALADPPHGGTVQAFIDGVVFGSPAGWVSRSDLTALFPAATYPGVANALGVTSFNTTTLANGVHTIFWVVTANNGQADGIGSRFFSVANSGLHAGPNADALEIQGREVSLQLDAPALQVPAGRTSGLSLRDEVYAAPLERRAIAGRRGFDLSVPFRSLSVGTSGQATLGAEQLDRIELQLRADGDPRTPDLNVESARAGATVSYTGYTRVGDDLGPLPIGSKLDEATGVFTWGAGVGFVHDYDLIFVRWVNSRAVSRQEIRITLRPQQSNRVGPQVTIDTPSANATVDRSFLVGGWALDLDEAVETGVETLHVWAYPVRTCGAAACDGVQPLFLGATAYGGERPDVAAIFGDRFKKSGYGLIVNSLPPGTYDLAVFAWSTVTGGFVPAKVVRVTVR